MRRRLLVAIAGVAVLTLAAYAIPRTLMVVGLVRDERERALDRATELVVKAIEHRVDAGGTIDEAVVADLVEPGEELSVELADGRVVSSAPLRGESVEATAPLSGGGEVRFRLASDSIDERVEETLVPVAVIGACAAALAILLAILLSRRLVRPFTALAGHAGALGGADQGAAPRSGLPEADRVADALDRAQARVAQMVQEEREFSANASHQLRTPLAALRLRIEDLTLWPEVDPTVATELQAALHEADRLAGTIDDLLQLARGGGFGAVTDIDLREVAAETVARWQAAFTGPERSLRLADSPAVVVSAPGAVLHVLDVLVENALVHGRGDVVVAVGERETVAVLRVADAGRIEGDTSRLFDRSHRSPTSEGSGIGLALARTLASTIGAQLRLAEADPTTFELTLPRRA